VNIHLIFSLAVLLLLSVVFVSAADKKSPAERKDSILKLFSDEFVSIQPGKDKFARSFKMGSDDSAAEKPIHTVKLGHSFAMAKYEVTQELYEAVMGKNPSKWPGLRNSVEMVNWKEANEFCAKATDELRKAKLLDEDQVIRLPTEAEWEYCCRAGTTTAYGFGDKADLLKDHAWFKDNSKGEDPPVGKKKANAWGLYDMHGYLWEWCADGWHGDYEGAPADGSAWQNKDGEERVLRGGAWNTEADTCRSAHRWHQPAETRTDAIGLRCVRAAK
jgi:formylglycine-generating enzyme required for sulfatase activity